MAKELKDSTRTLCRQLQDNPDVEGNKKKIESDKNDLIYRLELLNDELRDLSFGQFRQDIKDAFSEQGKFDRFRNEEKDLNLEIKKLNEDFKKAQDEYAKEANENNQEILSLKKAVNETKTDKDLQV